MKINKESAAHYIWGANCDGWRLVANDNLSVIHERMPPGTQEVRHYHQKARQFFFVLRGQAAIEMEGQLYPLNPHDGLEIPPQTPHQIRNQTDEDIEFLVISQPTTVGDRVAIE